MIESSKLLFKLVFHIIFAKFGKKQFANVLILNIKSDNLKNNSITGYYFYEVLLKVHVKINTSHKFNFTFSLYIKYTNATIHVILIWKILYYLEFFLKYQFLIIFSF